MAGLLDDPAGYLSGLLGAGWNRFRGVDPATGEADYWKRGGLAGLLGMPSWDEQPKTDIAMGFAGSTTPAVKGLGAARLPMDAASRLARAREMGFDTSRPVYHGTDTDFRAFDPERAVGTQFWSTTDKGAVEAGDVGARGQGVIKEMYHRIQNPAGWKEYDKFSIDELIARGYDGLALPEKDGHVTYVAFKPEQYRDVRAKFDPKKKDSRNLMAGVSALGLVGATGDY